MLAYEILELSLGSIPSVRKFRQYLPRAVSLPINCLFCFNHSKVWASGSVTLEVAAAGCPMVIMYQSSRVLWHIAGRFLVKTRNLSLVNILAGRELVPEFMPYFTSIEPIVDTIERLLEDKDKLAQISEELIELVVPLAEKKAGEEVAKIVIEMLH
jgi:lipid-A-disaccharide synthase